MPTDKFKERKYLETGFATPSGKVELYSTVLEELGFDPLPYYREAAVPSAEFPLSLFVGGRDDEYFHTGQRHVPELRKRRPEPTIFVNPADATSLDLEHGDWARVETSHGAVVMRTEVRDDMPKGLVRVPHGWWKPETEKGIGKLSGSWTFNDTLLSDDSDPDLMDLEQGIPHLKGIPCRVAKLTLEEKQDLVARYGESVNLPLGPAGRIEKPKFTDPDDFMYDETVGYGVEFDAVELAIYGKGSIN